MFTIHTFWKQDFPTSGSAIDPPELVAADTPDSMMENGGALFRSQVKERAGTIDPTVTNVAAFDITLPDDAVTAALIHGPENFDVPSDEYTQIVVVLVQRDDAEVPELVGAVDRYSYDQNPEGVERMFEEAFERVFDNAVSSVKVAVNIPAAVLDEALNGVRRSAAYISAV